MIMKRSQIIIGLILFLIIGLVFLAGYFLKSKDDIAIKEGIELYNIQEGETISPPLLIKGLVRGGNWSGFEGQVGRVELVQSDGTILGSAPLIATSDFMKFPISFEANLIFAVPAEENASLIFYNENPSGREESSRAVSFSVKISQEKTNIKLYFSKEGDSSCNDVFPIEREIVKTEGIARATIVELLKGLTATEKQAGYFTNINEGVKINSLTIVDGTAKIDFDEALERGIGGSCRVSAIRQQITQTLMQFSSVKKVIISISGKTEDILQP
jgi:hypothetical protein